VLLLDEIIVRFNSRYFRLLPRRSWELCSSGLWRSEEW